MEKKWACGHAGHEQDVRGEPRYQWIAIRVGQPTEVCQYFLQGMADRMAVSFHKYGPVIDTPTTVDEVAGLEKRLALYKETGNKEWLMDIANFAMIEYMLGRHPKSHFRATDSDESPGLPSKDGTESQMSHSERKQAGASGALATRMREGREGD